MKIASTNIDMTSTHAATQTHEVRESLRMWIGDRRPDFEEGRTMPQPATESARVTLSETGKAAQASEAEALEDINEQVENDPKLMLIRSLIEMLTGEEIRLTSIRRISSDDAAGSGQTSETQAPAGYGIEYDRHESHSESEQTTFSAAGTIRTTDGKEVAFSVNLVMQRSYSESSDVSLRMGDARRKQDPLVLNFNGSSAQLTDLRFDFDLNADGQKEQVKLATAGSGFLALDRNGNGRIDNGGELFGARTGNGFQELAALDQDGNGWVDEGDAAFSQLLVWSKSHDGSDSLTTLKQRNVGALYLGSIATSFEIKDGDNSLDGSIASSGVFLREDGNAGTIQKIDLTA